MVGKPSTENIDERIVKALGLDGEFEMSYEEYTRHLKEAMILSRMTKSRYSSEETMLFGAEFRRVRGKKGRFVIRVGKKKISAAGLGIGNFIKPLNIVKKRLMLAPGKGVSGVSSEQDIFSKIDDLLASILSNVAQQNIETKKQTEAARKDKENRKRKQKELGLEKGKEAIKNIVSAVTKPFQSVLEKIINFFVMTFLGRAFVKLIDWFSNPENKKKIAVIGRFLKDWWPALLGGFVLFGTRFGKAVRVLTAVAINGIRMLGGATVSLVKFAKRNPKTAGMLAAGAYGATQLTQRALGGGEEQNFWGGGFARKLFATGGRVTGPGGIDKVPAWLTNGEFVMSKGAVDRFGVGTLEAMNAAGGGTNVPTIGAGGVYAQGGGLFDFLPGTGTVMAPRGRELGFESKFLGFPTGRRTLSELKTYTEPNVQRYNKMRAQQGARDRLVKDMFGRHKSVTLSPTPSRRTTQSTTPSSRLQTPTSISSYSQNFREQYRQLTGKDMGTMSQAEAYKYMAQKYGTKTRAEQMGILSRESGGRVPPTVNQTTQVNMMMEQQKHQSLSPLRFSVRQKPVSSIKPLPKRQSKTSSMMNMGSQGAANKNNPTAQEPLPSFSAIHRKGTRMAEAVYGVRK
jgi:hypothetical protein